VPDAPTQTDASQGQGQFVWPPRDAGPIVEIQIEAEETSITPPARSEQAGWRDLLLDVEEFWLAPIAKPLPVRIEEAGWTPDPLDAYCNRCGLTVGLHEADEFGCSACVGRRLAWDRFVRLGEYAGPLAEWVQEVKFTGWRALGAALGRELGRASLDAGVRGHAAAPREVVVVPAPTAAIRRVTRGIDHTLVIARGMSQVLKTRPIRLLRARRRPSQRSVPASERPRNVAGAFSRRGRPPWSAKPLEGRTLVVVDDVRTSGATMAAAVRALRKGGWDGLGRPAEVWGAAVAVAARRP